MTENPLRRFLRRLGASFDPKDPEESFEAAGFDSWEQEGEPSTAPEHSGLVDAAGEGGVRSTHFQASFVRPAEYPAGWPFLPEQDVMYFEISAGPERIESVAWLEPEDLRSCIDTVLALQREAGWCLHVDTLYDPAGPVSQHLGWLHSGSDWRLLSVAPAMEGGAPNVVLARIRPEHLGGDAPPPVHAA